MNLAGEITAIMGISTVLLWMGYFTRHRTAIHQMLGILAVTISMAGAVHLVVGVHLLGREIECRAPLWAAGIHRMAATVVFLMMLMMAYTGLRGNRAWHIRWHKRFLLAYTMVYLSGVLLFR